MYIYVYVYIHIYIYTHKKIRQTCLAEIKLRNTTKTPTNQEVHIEFSFPCRRLSLNKKPVSLSVLFLVLVWPALQYFSQYLLTASLALKFLCQSFPQLTQFLNILKILVALKFPLWDWTELDLSPALSLTLLVKWFPNL